MSLVFQDSSTQQENKLFYFRSTILSLFTFHFLETLLLIIELSSTKQYAV